VNIDMLRRWVRNELAPAERREVGRWMLRCPDPALPEVLYGLVREHEEELADLSLRERAPARSFVIDLWRRLLDGGHATIEALRPPAVAGGPVLGPAATANGIAFREVQGEVVVDLLIAEMDRRVAVLATSDLGDEHLLLEPAELAAGRYADVARWTPDPAEGRVTLWLVLAATAIDPDAMRSLTDVERLVARGAASVVAARWTDPH
jgi:hypothetical protein